MRRSAVGAAVAAEEGRLFVLTGLRLLCVRTHGAQLQWMVPLRDLLSAHPVPASPASLAVRFQSEAPGLQADPAGPPAMEHGVRTLDFADTAGQRAMHELLSAELLSGAGAAAAPSAPQATD